MEKRGGATEKTRAPKRWIRKGSISNALERFALRRKINESQCGGAVEPRKGRAPRCKARVWRRTFTIGCGVDWKPREKPRKLCDGIAEKSYGFEEHIVDTEKQGGSMFCLALHGNGRYTRRKGTAKNSL